MRDAILAALAERDLQTYWRLEEAREVAYTLEPPDPIDLKALQEASLDVAEAMSSEEFDCLPLSERIGGAAKTLLDPKACIAFTNAWQLPEDPHIITPLDLVMALLSKTIEVPAIIVFGITEELVKEAAEPLLERVKDATPQQLPYYIGWLEHLPTKIETRSLSDEITEDFISRSCYTLRALTSLYRRAHGFVELPVVIKW